MDKRRGAANSEDSAVPGVELISVAKEWHEIAVKSKGKAWSGNDRQWSSMARIAQQRKGEEWSRNAKERKSLAPKSIIKI